MSMTLSNRNFVKGFEDTWTLKPLRSAMNIAKGKDKTQGGVLCHEHGRSVTVVRSGKYWDVKRTS